LATPEESKFIVRWLVGNLKTGAGDKTILTALAKAIVLNPPGSKDTVEIEDV
jgi:ATP-dependent DNA ligase